MLLKAAVERKIAARLRMKPKNRPSLDSWADKAFGYRRWSGLHNALFNDTRAEDGSPLYKFTVKRIEEQYSSILFFLKDVCSEDELEEIKKEIGKYCGVTEVVEKEAIMEPTISSESQNGSLDILRFEIVIQRMERAAPAAGGLYCISELFREFNNVFPDSKMPYRFYDLDSTKDYVELLTDQYGPGKVYRVTKSNNHYVCYELFLTYVMWLRIDLRDTAIKAMKAVARGEHRNQSSSISEESIVTRILDLIVPVVKDRTSNLLEENTEIRAELATKKEEVDDLVAVNKAISDIPRVRVTPMHESLTNFGRMENVLTSEFKLQKSVATHLCSLWMRYCYKMERHFYVDHQSFAPRDYTKLFSDMENHNFRYRRAEGSRHLELYFETSTTQYVDNSLGIKRTLHGDEVKSANVWLMCCLLLGIDPFNVNLKEGDTPSWSLFGRVRFLHIGEGGWEQTVTRNHYVFSPALSRELCYGGPRRIDEAEISKMCLLEQELISEGLESVIARMRASIKKFGGGHWDVVKPIELKNHQVEDVHADILDKDQKKA